MKKKLTKDSFVALRAVGVVLDEQQARATKGGGYFDDYGTGYYDSSGNYHWNSTSSGSSSGYYGSSSGSYGSSSGGSSSSSGWISQDAFYNWSGTWNGGYVEGLGYVGPDTVITGSSSGYSSSSPYYDPNPIPNGTENQYRGAYDYGYQFGASGGNLASALQAYNSIAVSPGTGYDSDPAMLNMSKGFLDGFQAGQKARNY